MPCDRIVRARAQKIQQAVPEGLTHDDIMRLTGAVGHDEAHHALEHMTDDQFKEFLRKLEAKARKRRQATENYVHLQMGYTSRDPAGVA